MHHKIIFFSTSFQTGSRNTTLNTRKFLLKFLNPWAKPIQTFPIAMYPTLTAQIFVVKGFTYASFCNVKRKHNFSFSRNAGVVTYDSTFRPTAKISPTLKFVMGYEGHFPVSAVLFPVKSQSSMRVRVYEAWLCCVGEHSNP